MRKNFLFPIAVSILLTNAAIAQPAASSSPIKPTQSPVLPGNAASTAEAASPLGAIQRSNPVVVPPPQPNSAEQSYSRGSGFVAQHGSSPTQGAPLSSQGPSVHGASSGQNTAKPYASTPAPTDLGKGSLNYERRPNPSIQPITPAPSPATQAGQQGKR